MLQRVTTTKNADGYTEQLYKSKKRYYRIVRTQKGNMYSIFTNDSAYGEPRYDREMMFKNKIVREYTIKECKESIKVYDLIN